MIFVIFHYWIRFVSSLSKCSQDDSGQLSINLLASLKQLSLEGATFMTDGWFLQRSLMPWRKISKASSLNLTFRSMTKLTGISWGLLWSAWILEKSGLYGLICVYPLHQFQSLYVNGSPSPSFNMERGLRQCYPLSPFLFNHVAQTLPILVNQFQSK